MNKARDFVYINRNICALFILGFCLALLAAIGGACILAKWHQVPNATAPRCRLGQWMMLFGLCNLVVYVCLFFQVRGLKASQEANA